MNSDERHTAWYSVSREVVKRGGKTRLDTLVSVTWKKASETS